MKKILLFLLVITVNAALNTGCSPKDHPRPAPLHQVAPGELTRMNYSIQVGAFSVLDNAVRLMTRLEELGLEAYYFKDSDGLYKVRFGNHPTLEQAHQEAKMLQSAKTIQNYFVVVPESYAAARIPPAETELLRREIVRTAHGFIGVPYRWGGTSEQSGFDCSGLTMVVYRQNGLNLPRVSRNQFNSGRKIPLQSIGYGDLVFFATARPNQVSHVGIYIGQGRFIHAPATGRNVTIEHLSNPYFRSRFMGARTYL